jgi:hypothetical protein
LEAAHQDEQIKKTCIRTQRKNKIDNRKQYESFHQNKHAFLFNANKMDHRQAYDTISDKAVS